MVEQYLAWHGGTRWSQKYRAPCGNHCGGLGTRTLGIPPTHKGNWRGATSQIQC